MPLRLLALLLLFGCPSQRPAGDDDDASDDDDSAADDDDDAGSAPVIELADFCEVPLAENNCNGTGDDTNFAARARLTLSDVDGDLENFDWSLELVGPPAFTGIFEGSLGEGGIFQVEFCNTWIRGDSLPFTAIVWDAAENESDPVSGDWLIPTVSGDDTCP